MTTYTHVGRKAATGHYAVTADAYRKPGKVHAANRTPGTAEGFVALCGERLTLYSGDHFLQAEPQVVRVSPGHRITCKRCLKVMAKRGA